nr:helix-turn-helix domain-containing protein [Micromonospora sp. DSM 115978]
MTRRRFVGAAGLTAFNGAVRRSLVSQVVEVGDPETFRAGLREVGIGPVRLVSAAVNALRSQRTVTALPASGSVFLLLSDRARGGIRHRYGTEPITPDRLVVVPDAEPFTVEYPDPSRLLFVVLPPAVVAGRYPALDGRIRSAPLEPAARALVRQLPHLMSATEAVGSEPSAALTADAGPAELASILDATLHLTLRRTLGDTAGDPLVALRVAAERLIETRLTEPGLGVSWLAAKLAVSVRQLHRAFDATDATVAGFIRDRRLAACARGLLDEPSASVTDLAHRHGFASASHLGTLFRARYGTTPGRWRAHSGAAPATRHGSDPDQAPR